MTCPELQYGSAAYYGAMAVGVGALLRIVKRLLPDTQRVADAVPALAFALGYALDLACQLLWCGYDAKAGAVAALAGGLMGGLPAAGGHEMLVRSARIVGLESAAEWLLGRASKAAKSKQPPSVSKGTIVLMAALALAPAAGCMQGGFATVTAEAVNSVVEKNNALVDALQKVHDETVLQRRRVLSDIAKFAVDKRSGEVQLNLAIEAYNEAFVAFEKAETIQNALAEVLEAAQQGIKAGQRPDLNAVVAALLELQQAYAAVMQALAEVR